MSEARRLVSDLRSPNRLLYWMDFLFHVGLGWCAFVLTLQFPTFSLGQMSFYLLSSLALYRAVLFIHELTHLKKNTFRVFRRVWNVTCGFPLMVPSFMYLGVHSDHHKPSVYGTGSDGEYVPFAAQRPYKIALYVLLAAALPLLLAGRFIVLTPLAYLGRSVRRFTWERGSSLTIDWRYRRPRPSSKDEKTWRVQELLAFVYGTTAIALVLAQVLPYRALVLWYLVGALIFLLNSLRTLAAHCYRNPGERVMNLSEQYLDSVNVAGNPFLTALWAPVGLRYHATHHLFPGMPYHALGEAHRRLVNGLSDNTLYMQASRASLRDALTRLWKEAALATASK